MWVKISSSVLALPPLPWDRGEWWALGLRLAGWPPRVQAPWNKYVLNEFISGTLKGLAEKWSGIYIGTTGLTVKEGWGKTLFFFNCRNGGKTSMLRKTSYLAFRAEEWKPVWQWFQGWGALCEWAGSCPQANPSKVFPKEYFVFFSSSGWVGYTVAGEAWGPQPVGAFPRAFSSLWIVPPYFWEPGLLQDNRAVLCDADVCPLID